MIRWFFRLFQRVKEAIFSLGPAFEFLQHHVPPVDRLTQWKFEYLRRRFEEWRPKRVLDVGCSTGHISPLLGDMLYVGLDINRSYLRHAKRRYPAGYFLAVEEMGPHPFRDGQFDLALILCALHHISDATLARVLPEVERSLAPDGRVLVIEGMAAEHHASWLVWGMLKLDMGTHFRTPQELRTLLGRHFEVTDYREENSREDGRGYRLPCFVLGKKGLRPEAVSGVSTVAAVANVAGAAR